MILKFHQAREKKEFLGVQFDLLAVGKQSMITKMRYTTDNHVPFHQHPHEQSGYVLSGKYRLQFGEYNEILTVGDTYSIPGNTEHSFEIIEAGEVIDFFSPPREDFLAP